MRTSAPKACFICGAKEYQSITASYWACTDCGHETLCADERQAYIINDALDEKNLRRKDALDRFRGAVLKRFSDGVKPVCLVDIGSASGKFLFHYGQRFERSLGIEITEAAVEFSRKVFRLHILPDLKAYDGMISVATCWHSLEHFPVGSLCKTLDLLSRQLMSGGRVIVSVPNNRSWQYRMFGEAYAYFDVPSHLHQFSPMSLRLLFERFGFRQAGFIVSWPYNMFGYVQALLNVMTGSHNYLYYRLKRRSAKPSIIKDLVHGMLLAVAIPVGVVMGIFDGVWPCRQGVITACFERK